MKVAFDHYSVYAGDTGFRFVRNTLNNPVAFDIWAGFFDPIMTCLFDLYSKRKAILYLPILREWNELVGFRDDAATVLDLCDLKEAINALRRIDSALLTEHCPSYYAKLSKVLADLISFLESAFQAGETVTLSEEN